jgi:TctA family transporter
MDVIEAVKMLIQGIGLVGNSLSFFIQYILAYFGINIPATYISVATIIITILLVWKVGEAMNKILLLALIIFGISQVTGLIQLLLGALK